MKLTLPRQQQEKLIQQRTWDALRKSASKGNQTSNAKHNAEYWPEPGFAG